MLESRNEKALYPLIAVASSLIILAASLFLAPKNGYIYLAAEIVLMIIFGMGKYVLKILPVGVVIGGLYFLICYLISHSVSDSLAGTVRILGVCLAMVPGMSIPPVNLTRALNQLKAPRGISLGILITLRFFPLLGNEIRCIRDAMKTRGADHSPETFYRSTILPFCVRLVNISDLLALSVETRGFSVHGSYSVWKKVRIRAKDILYIVITLDVFILAVIYLPEIKILWVGTE